MKPGEIPISDAADICKKRGCAYVVVFGVRQDGERFHVTTYGMTKKLCKVAGSIGDQFADAVMKLHVKPPANEPPTVVCLCGSTRFGDAFRAANLRETLAGRIVLTIGCDFKSDDGLGLTPVDKARLDELHLRKIDMADEVLILNVGGYIGESTKRELAYAREQGKTIRFLESE